MPDNLTWPEILFVAPKIYACGTELPFSEADSYDLSETQHAIGGIKYIRIDIAKEREKKLIDSCCNFTDSARYLDDMDYLEIYQKGGLEELK